MNKKKSSIEKKVEISLLLAFYAPLLTEHQQKVLQLSNGEDLSLGEIAEQLNISRQGIHDIITRGSKQLYLFEEKLGMYQRIQEMEDHVNKAICFLQQVEVFPESRQKLTDAMDALNELLLQGEDNDGF
ncbi:MAG: HTH domain-containing protein [Clostridiales bacterium]|nr:HTH domain-containing protein [Clostridiales bacterium]